MLLKPLSSRKEWKPGGETAHGCMRVLGDLTSRAVELQDIAEAPGDDGRWVPGDRERLGCDVPRRQVLGRILGGCKTTVLLYVRSG